MTFSRHRRALPGGSVSRRPGMAGGPRGVTVRRGGKLLAIRNVQMADRQLPAPAGEVGETDPAVPRSGDHEDSCTGNGGTGNGDNSGRESPSPARVTDSTRSERRSQALCPGESGRVTREWLRGNARSVEYEDRNIPGEIDSRPEPDGEVEVGHPRGEDHGSRNGQGGP